MPYKRQTEFSSLNKPFFNDLNINYTRNRFMKKALFLLTTFFTLVVSNYSCVTVDPVIVGNQNTRTEYRNCDYFEKLSSSVPFHITVKNGLTPSVEIIAESNLIPYILTEINNKTLYIDIESNTELINNSPIEIVVTTPNINTISEEGSGEIITDYFEPTTVDLEVSGSGTIDAAFNTNDLYASVSGSGKIILEGTSSTSDMEVSGPGAINAFSLSHQDGNATISGDGNIYINAKRSLNVNISGSGCVYYISYPLIYTHISGYGRLINANN